MALWYGDRPRDGWYRAKVLWLDRVELTGIDIDRVVDGEIVEHWSEADVPPLMAELATLLPQ